ncbi:hypothetical protein GCM10009808_00920 [Microbacterium sediminicola]|uniref:SseB protein N-terminal domain-containing protein n=1 Tax=Microbacterium sediminicola TaxID=415210 RepID=A0ABN2HGV9_9MICO
MALFSRRSSNADNEKRKGEAAAAEQEAADSAAPAGSDVPETAPDAAPDAPAVGISMSSFQGLGAAQPTAPAAPTAPTPPAATTPAGPSTPAGLQDNAPIKAALAALPEKPETTQILHVARQMLQGNLFLRVKGDAKKLLAEGANLPLAVTNIGDKQFILAYSGVEALKASLAADAAADTSAMSQPARAVMRFVLAGTYAGVILDPASAPARAVLSRELIAQLVEQADPDTLVKQTLAAPRTAKTPTDVVNALGAAKLWVATNKPAGSDRMGVAEARSKEGERYLEVFTHPVEIAALGRGDRPAPITGAKIGAALRADANLSGILIDPAGPWIRLSRAELQPLVALAPPPAG